MRCVLVITYPKSFGESSSGKERWGFSRRGWLLLTSAGAYFAFLNVHLFLAVTHRVHTNILVVEGSIQRYAIREVLRQIPGH